MPRSSAARSRDASDTKRTPSAKGSSKAGAARGASSTTTKPTKPKPLFRTYDDAVRFLEARVDLERARLTRQHRGSFKLDRIKALAKRLGDPQNAMRIVHVAGTKGKGSTCAMLASCLEGCGYTVGLYTSPHLVEVRERVQINGEMITTDEFRKAMHRVAVAAAAIEGRHGEATYFELLTALGFVHFADKAVDIAVIEVGLGGRLDATNIVRPDVAIVTEVSLDHTQVLGDTVEEIAREKAGIFKSSGAAITRAQEPGVIAAMREVAEQNGTTLEVLGEDIDFSFRFESSADLGPHHRVCVTTPRSGFEHFPSPLQGEHQAHNCGLALAALDRLRARGLETPESDVSHGLACTTLAGRMEQVYDQPRIILDGAHNAASIGALIKTIGAHIPYDSMVLIFGCAVDKDIRAMLQKVDLGADKVIFTRSSNNPRAADPIELQRVFTEVSGKMSQVVPTLKDAINTAYRAVGKGDLILVSGSFYLVGEAKALLAGVSDTRRTVKA